MTNPRDDSQELLQALVEHAEAELGAPLDEHPGIDTLAGYLASELDTDDEARVRSHLVACHECTQTLLDIDPIVTAMETEVEVEDLATAASWREFRKTVRPKPVTNSRPLYAIAATLAAGLIGLSLWVGNLRGVNSELERTVAELSKPQINPPIAYLDEVTRSAPEGSVIEIPTGQPFVLLIVVPDAPETFASYEVDLLDDQDAAVWRSNGLGLSEEGTLRVRLPSRLLPDGDYRARVTGLDGVAGTASETLLDTAFRVQHR